jgi:hypothetical protein
MWKWGCCCFPLATLARVPHFLSLAHLQASPPGSPDTHGASACPAVFPLPGLAGGLDWNRGVWKGKQP